MVKTTGLGREALKIIGRVKRTLEREVNVSGTGWQILFCPPQ